MKSKKETKKETEAEKPLVLPAAVIGQVEVARLNRELADLADRLTKLPAVSHGLEELAQTNHIDLSDAAARQKLSTSLRELQSTAPRLHISFASDPSPAFIAKIITWLRREIHPHTLLQIGLQPSIAAGCIVRSPNRVFDFSLRQSFASQRQLLISKLGTQE